MPSRSRQGCLSAVCVGLSRTQSALFLLTKSPSESRAMLPVVFFEFPASGMRERERFRFAFRSSRRRRGKAGSQLLHQLLRGLGAAAG